MSFDWQTEDRHWDEQEPPRRHAGRRTLDWPEAEDAAATAPEPAETPAPIRPRRRWLYVAAIGGLVVALVAVLYWQLDRRSTLAQARLTSEVAASHATILDAAQRGDGELFVSFLSGRDAAWSRAQERLVRAGGFVDRAAFDLHWTPAAPVSPTVTLAPDLRAAELTAPQAYVVAIGNGLTETITLQQTAIYRRGPDRWLYSPPEEDFWGQAQAMGNRYVRVHYHARDADVVEPLARDMDAALAELCRLVGELCAGNIFIDLTFSTDPAALSEYRTPQDTWAGGGKLTLPTPTLFGRPADDAAYRALSRAYTSRVVSAAAANLAGWACCNDQLFYGALLDAQLGQLGLRPWPLEAAAHETLVARPELLRDVEGLWPGGNATPEQRLAVYALVDFLVARNDAPIIEMQRLLLDESTGDYWSWLARVTNGAFASPAAFERALLSYSAERRRVTAPPLPLPAQVLQLVCRQADAVWPALYRYDSVNGQLTYEQELTGFEEPMIVGLPGREGIAVFAREREQEFPLTYLWRDGETTTVYPGATDSNPRLIALPDAPKDDALLVVHEGSPVYALLLLNGCLQPQATCMTTPLLGAIAYSPDATRSLLVAGEPSPFSDQVGTPRIYLGDAEGQVHSSQDFVEAGISPFWLSDDTFGYVATRQDNSGQEQVILRTIAPSRGNIRLTASADGSLFSVQDLEPLVGSRVENGLTIDRVLPNSAADELLVFTAGPGIPEQANLALTYDLTTGELRPRFALADETFDYRRAYRRAYRFSPDDRWLAVSTLAWSATPGVQGTVDWWVYVHATDSSLTRRYALRAGDTWPAHWLSDWSADGRWLALATGGYVRLVAPQEDYSLPIILPDMACSAAVWVQG